MTKLKVSKSQNQFFRLFFGQWSFKKNCFWDVLTFTVWTVNDVLGNLYPSWDIYTLLLFCAIQSSVQEFPKGVSMYRFPKKGKYRFSKKGIDFPKKL